MVFGWRVDLQNVLTLSGDDMGGEENANELHVEHEGYLDRTHR
jgi:hypothetical protein